MRKAWMLALLTLVANLALLQSVAAAQYTREAGTVPEMNAAQSAMAPAAKLDINSATAD